jgi:hypothetical protein
MKILVLQHIVNEHPGLFRHFLREDRFSWDTIEVSPNMGSLVAAQRRSPEKPGFSTRVTFRSAARSRSAALIQQSCINAISSGPFEGLFIGRNNGRDRGWLQLSTFPRHSIIPEGETLAPATVYGRQESDENYEGKKGVQHSAGLHEPI